MYKEKEISLCLLGEYGLSERERIKGFFAHSLKWRIPWELVTNSAQADYFLVSCDVSDTKQEGIQLWQQKHNISRQYMISYSQLPSVYAQWHLPRSMFGVPSFFRLTSLLDKINKAKQEAVAPKNTDLLQKILQAKSAPTPAACTNRASIRQKILVAGSVGAGKTEAINTLTKGRSFSTEARPSDQASLQKSSTTVAMDFGVYQHDEETIFRLYGSPGQRRFDFMQDVLLEKTSGLILLLNNQMSDVLAELNYYLGAYDDFLRERPAVIGVTHNELSPIPSLKTYSQLLQQHGNNWPVFKVDARKYSDMHALVDALIQQQAFQTA